MKARITIIALILLIVITATAFAGCAKKETDDRPFCIVTFKNWDGTTLQINKCIIGMGVNAPVDPIRAEDEYNTYTFDHWDHDLSEFTENTTVTAVFKSTHVIRVNLVMDGETLYSWKYWDAVKLAELPTPTKEGKEFDAWYVDIPSGFKLTMEVLKGYDPALEDRDFQFVGLWKEQ